MNAKRRGGVGHGGGLPWSRSGIQTGSPLSRAGRSGRTLPGCCVDMRFAAFPGCRPAVLCLPVLFHGKGKGVPVVAELAAVDTTLVLRNRAAALKTLTAAAVAFPQREGSGCARDNPKSTKKDVNSTTEQLIAHFSQNPPKAGLF